MENLRGGVLHAKSSCDLLRDRKQADNLKYAAKHKLVTISTSYQHDILAHVMQMCKSSSDSDTEFVRSVEAAPEPICMLAANQQLLDMKHFCTGDASSVLSIDPTFNLGPFSVMPVMYRNALMEIVRSKTSPISLGPVLIHQTKTMKPFHYSVSTLIH